MALKRNDVEGRVRRYMQRCVHFNGIQNDRCKAGVLYDDVNKDGKAIPCIPLDAPQGSCKKFQYFTEEEARAKVQRQDESLDRTISRLAEGCCPICGQSVKHRQSGACVYGVPCGHRLYQRKINPQFAE